MCVCVRVCACSVNANCRPCDSALFLPQQQHTRRGTQRHNAAQTLHCHCGTHVLRPWHWLTPHRCCLGWQNTCPSEWKQSCQGVGTARKSLEHHNKHDHVRNYRMKTTRQIPYIANRVCLAPSCSKLLKLFNRAISQMHERSCIIKHGRNLHSFPNRKHLKNLSCIHVCIPLFIPLKVE